jgi:hypothetical protein
LARQRDRGPPATILAPAALTQARSIKYQLSNRHPDGGGVKWLGATAVPGTHFSAESYELLHDFSSVGRRGNVQCRIACVDISLDLVPGSTASPSRVMNLAQSMCSPTLATR